MVHPFFQFSNEGIFFFSVGLTHGSGKKTAISDPHSEGRYLAGFYSDIFYITICFLFTSLIGLFSFRNWHFQNIVLSQSDPPDLIPSSTKNIQSAFASSSLFLPKEEYFLNPFLQDFRFLFIFSFYFHNPDEVSVFGAFFIWDN